MSTDFAIKCAELRLDLIMFARDFLWVALIIAIVGALVDLLSKILPLFQRQGFPPATKGISPADPVKLLDTLRAFFESIAKAPTWLAAAGVSIALIWTLSYLLPPNCSVA
jgi:hypothetical protein